MVHLRLESFRPFNPSISLLSGVQTTCFGLHGRHGFPLRVSYADTRKLNTQWLHRALGSAERYSAGDQNPKQPRWARITTALRK